MIHQSSDYESGFAGVPLVVDTEKGELVRRRDRGP
jgi:hypothetical protein